MNLQFRQVSMGTVCLGSTQHYLGQAGSWTLDSSEDFLPYMSSGWCWLLAGTSPGAINWDTCLWHGSCLPRVSLPRERTRFEAVSLFLDLVCKVDWEGVAKKIGRKPGIGYYKNQKRRLGKMEFRKKELIWMTVKLLQIWVSMILWMSQIPPIWEILTLLYLWANKLPDDSLGLSKDCKPELLAMQNFVSGT